MLRDDEEGVSSGASLCSYTDSAGRTSTSSSESFCAPLVPSPGWRGPVSFVVCESERSALPAMPGIGVVEGRITRAYTPNDRAIEALAGQGVIMAPGARVVSPTGPLQATLATGVLAFGVLLLVGTALSALITVRAAVTRDGPPQ